VDCASCGAFEPTKTRCEVCGFAFPADGDAAPLAAFFGLVCTACDTYNDSGAVRCVACAAPLDDEDAAVAAPPASPVSPAAPPASPVAPPVSPVAPPVSPVAPPAAPPSLSFASPLPAWSAPLPSTSAAPTFAPSPAARPFPSPPLPPLPPLAAPSGGASTSAGVPCWRCSTTTGPGDKFCRHCGARVAAAPAPPGAAGSATQVIPAARPVSVVPAAALGALAPPAPAALPAPSAPAAAAPSPTMFFGAVTVERSAKLILVRGHTQFGTQWRLQAGETALGRNSGVVLFPDDNALADRHARLVFRGADLFVEPLPSTNGVFIRLREPARLHQGDEFIVGAQRLRLLHDHERPVAASAVVDAAGTHLQGSAVRPGQSTLALARITSDPTHTEVYVRYQRLLTLGRTTCDVNFAADGFVSERHAQLTQVGDHVLLEDLKSRNGTYARVSGPWKLAHGDLLLAGEQVLRVELNTPRG